MHVIKEEYGPFVIKLCKWDGKHLKAEANAFAGVHNCQMDRDFRAMNLNGGFETVSRYDPKNNGRCFEVGEMEFNGKFYKIKSGTHLKEVDPMLFGKPGNKLVTPVQKKEPIKQEEPTKQEEPIKQEEPVKEKEPEIMPTFEFDDTMFESFTYCKYAKLNG